MKSLVELIKESLKINEGSSNDSKIEVNNAKDAIEKLGALVTGKNGIDDLSKIIKDSNVQSYYCAEQNEDDEEDETGGYMPIHINDWFKLLKSSKKIELQKQVKDKNHIVVYVSLLDKNAILNIRLKANNNKKSYNDYESSEEDDD